jgi:hypothetical protein
MSETNEELLEMFENLNFNAGFNSAKNQDRLNDPKTVYGIKEKILERMNKKYA